MSPTIAQVFSRNAGNCPAVITVPRLTGMLRNAIPHLIEATIIPLVLFYTALWLFDVLWALVAAIAWSYTALIRRVIQRRRVGGLLYLTAATLTVRAALALASGSVMVYFLQSPIAKAGVGLAFLGSVWLGRPLLQRLAGDFIHLPEELTEHPAVARCFRRLTVMWAGILTVHAGIVTWMLLSQSVSTYLITKTMLDFGIKGAAIAASFVLFRRAVHREGITIAFG